MRILLALGGNALLRRGEPATPPGQERSVKVAAAEIAGIAEEHEVVVTHGNGPQVGQMLELALRNELPERDVVSVLTEVVVAAGGPDGESSRQSVAPRPQAIAAIRSLRVLVDSGALVVCADRGFPIALDGLGTMLRVETDLDRDLTAALLARRLDADLLVMLTGVDPDLTAGPMAPKVEAACRFAETTGRRAAIGALADVDRVVRGEVGAQVAAGEGGRVATR